MQMHERNKGNAISQNENENEKPQQALFGREEESQ